MHLLANYVYKISIAYLKTAFKNTFTYIIRLPEVTKQCICWNIVIKSTGKTEIIN